MGASLSLVALACGPAVQVSTAYDRRVDHDQYETFAMLQPNRPVPSDSTDVDPFVLLRLRQLTYLELRAHGLKPTSKDRADLVVGVEAARDSQVYVYSAGPYFYDPIYGPMGSTQVTRVDEGIVVVDLVDRRKKSVVWRGTGVSNVGRSLSEEELAQMVSSILAKYPPDRATDE